MDEFLQMLAAHAVEQLIDVRTTPKSRRNPQFGQAALAETLSGAGIVYRHEVELGGRRSGEPGEELFACIRTPAFRSYAARMSQPVWQEALRNALAQPTPCFMCAETVWWRCHRSLIAELLTARGHRVVHLLRPGARQPHRPSDDAEVRDGKLFLCGEFVA